MPREKKTHVGAQVNYGKCKIPITVSPVSPGKCLRKERATRAESESEIWGEREIEEEKETEDRGREEWREGKIEATVNMVLPWAPVLR